MAFQSVPGTSKEAPREAKSATRHIDGGSSVVILEPWWRCWASWEIPSGDEHANPTAIGFIFDFFGTILELSGSDLESFWVLESVFEANP